MNPATYVVLEHLLALGQAFFTGAGDFDQVIHRWAGADVGSSAASSARGWRNVESCRSPAPTGAAAIMAWPTAALKNKAVVSYIQSRKPASGRAYAGSRTPPTRWSPTSTTGRSAAGSSMPVQWCCAPYQSIPHRKRPFSGGRHRLAVEGWKLPAALRSPDALRIIAALRLTDPPASFQSASKGAARPAAVAAAVRLGRPAARR